MKALQSALRHARTAASFRPQKSAPSVLITRSPCARRQPVGCARQFSTSPSVQQFGRNAKGTSALVGLFGAAAAGWLYLQNRPSSELLCEPAIRTESEENLNAAVKSTEDLTQTEISRKMADFVQNLQSEITAAVEEAEGPDGGRFFRDSWVRKEGGVGISCIMQDGKVFEKAGVNISIIASKAPEQMLAHMRARKREGIDKGPYNMFVAGISLVLHPHNPMAPTVHANYRYFELVEEGGDHTKPVAWWFGGGCDLTPSYLFEEDAVHFHKVIKQACDKHDAGYYPKFKKWCDEYFDVKHRGERRGIGGIFFDDLENKDPNEIFEFVHDCGHSFVEQYMPILEKRKDLPYTEENKRWQQMRRGRYVEFNLVHDRGTKFGLATPGVRIESVLMSLPLKARWEYGHTPEPGTPEAKLLEVLKNPKDWV